MMALVYILVASLLLIGSWIVIDALKLRRLRKQRQTGGFTRDNFVAAFRSLDVPDAIPTAVFDYYSHELTKDLPLSPDDTFSAILHDDPEDIEEDSQKLVERLEMRLPHDYELREYGDKPVASLRDMVLWLDWIRQHQLNYERTRFLTFV